MTIALAVTAPILAVTSVCPAATARMTPSRTVATSRWSDCQTALASSLLGALLACDVTPLKVSR